MMQRLDFSPLFQESINQFREIGRAVSEMPRDSNKNGI